MMYDIQNIIGSYINGWMVLLFLFPFYGETYCSYTESCWEIYSMFILFSFKCYTIKLWVRILILKIFWSFPLSL